MGKGLETEVQRPRIWDQPMLGIAWMTTHKPFTSEPTCTMETQYHVPPRAAAKVKGAALSGRGAAGERRG